MVWGHHPCSDAHPGSAQAHIFIPAILLLLLEQLARSHTHSKTVMVYMVHGRTNEAAGYVYAIDHHDSCAMRQDVFSNWYAEDPRPSFKSHPSLEVQVHELGIGHCGRLACLGPGWSGDGYFDISLHDLAGLKRERSSSVGRSRRVTSVV